MVLKLFDLFVADCSVSAVQGHLSAVLATILSFYSQVINSGTVWSGKTLARVAISHIGMLSLHRILSNRFVKLLNPIHFVGRGGGVFYRLALKRVNVTK